MAKGKITRKAIAEDKVFKIGVDYATSLQPAIEANKIWLDTFPPIKQAALEYAKIQETIKRAENRTEFLKIKQEEDLLRVKATNNIKTEQAALVAKQKVEQAEIDTKKKLVTLANQKNKLQQKTIKLTEKEKLELRILNRGKREAAVISSKLSTAYEKLAVKLIRLRRTYKKVALTQGESSKRALNLKNHINSLDATLKRVDANVGQFQRSVGNYGKALSAAGKAARGLASAMGLVGGAFLVIQVMRDAIKVVRDFGKQNATLSAILQVERKEMRGLTDDAINLGATTVKTAGEVVGLQIAYARLGFSQREIIDLTRATISGSIAMNAELDKTANLVGAVVNTFDDFSSSDAPKIIDILSLATAKSALNFEKLEKALPIVGGAANAAGIPFTKLVALLGKLADSGIDASSSSTALRNIFIESAAQGLNYTQILDKIKDSQDKLTASNDEFGKRAAVSATVLAANIEKTDELNEALTRAAGTAKGMANKELDTLDGSIKLLRSAWEGYILKQDEASDGSTSLKGIILNLANNLDKILGTLVFLTKGWLLYKAAVFLARIQTSLANKQMLLSRKAALASSKGISRATIAWTKFNKVVKANAFSLAVLAIYGLVEVLGSLNKSLAETVEELHASNEEFFTQTTSTINLNAGIAEMADRYDELKDKAKLNKDEQIELDDIIKKIAKHVPDAVTEVNKYGTALEINTDKAKKFAKANGQILALEAKERIRKLKEVLEELTRAQDIYNKLSKEGGEINIDQTTTIKKINGVLKIRKGLLNDFRNLTDKERLSLLKRQQAIEGNIDVTKRDIEANQDIIGLATGIKNARQLEADANAKAKKEAELLAVKKEAEVLIIKKLKGELANLKTSLNELTKNGYNKLTTAQGESVVETRKAIAEKQKEIDAILGITNAKKDAAKAAKEQKAAEAKLRQDAFKLGAFSLKLKIKEQKDIAKNEKESFEARYDAVKTQSELELELAFLTAKNKFDTEKEFSDKEIEALLTKSKVSKEVQKKIGDEELLIIKQFQEEKRRIKSQKEGSEDDLDISKIQANAAIKKAQKQKELNEELILENDKFQKELLATNDREKSIEAHERRVANIKKKYAIEALNVQVNAIEELLKSEELSAKLRAEYEAKLSALKLRISNLTTDKSVENSKTEVKSAKEKAIEILEISAELANALGDLANALLDGKIQKIDDEIQANEDKYDRLLDNENLTEDQRKALETQREADREKLEKKKAKEQRKQAILGKALAALNVGLLTAQAVLAALAFPPIGLGPIAGLPLAATTATLGAIQLAAVLAAPIPKFVMGTQNAPEGWALVDELGPEIHTDKRGNIKSTGSTKGANYRYLEKGDKIYKHQSHDDYDRLMRASILTSVQIDNKKLSDFQAKQVFNLNNDGLLDKLDSVENAIKRSNTLVNVQDNSHKIAKAIADEMWFKSNTDW